MKTVERLQALLERIQADRSLFVGGIPYPMIDAEHVPLEDIPDVVAWMKAQGEFRVITNEDQYKEMGNTDTGHIWFYSKETSMHCGFKYMGNCNTILRACLTAAN